MSRRISSWLSDCNILRLAQKNFLPYDGVYENNFILEQIIQSARAQGKDVCLLSTDISSGFGLVPHETILCALTNAGVGDTLVDIIRDIYSNNFTFYMTDEDPSQPVSLSRGVKQGCPLSGLLFCYLLCD